MNQLCCFEKECGPLLTLLILLMAVVILSRNQSSMDYDELLLMSMSPHEGALNRFDPPETTPTRHSAQMQATPSNWLFVWSDRRRAPEALLLILLP